MKKVILLFFFSIFFSISPVRASASIFTDFANWIVPNELKTGPTPAPKKTIAAVGGVTIVAEPDIISGDTSRAYNVRAGLKRTFRVSNMTAGDLFLNKAPALTYSATPRTHDVSSALVLPSGEERAIVVTNSSLNQDVFLSKTDLGVISLGTSTQPLIFLSGGKAKSNPIVTSKDGSVLANFTFSFDLNNASNKDIYVSKLINPLHIVELSVSDKSVASIKFIESTLRYQAGDTDEIFVIPAGTNRGFELTGILDNTKGTAGAKSIAVKSVNYSFSPALLSPQSLVATAELRAITPAPVILSTGMIKKVQPKAVVPSVVPTPVITATPSISLAPIPSVSATPSLAPTPLASPSVPNEPELLGEFVVSDTSTKIGTPIMESGQVLGYPVNFVFTLEAQQQNLYVSKIPLVAFVTDASGFGAILPTVNNITPSVISKNGDGSNYFLLKPGEPRTFTAFAVLRNDGLATAGSKIFQISKINYGIKSSALREFSTIQNTANLKAIVKLSPKTTPKPSVSASASPSLTPLPSVAATFSAICYPTPPNPSVNETVYWQVAQSGGVAPFTYVWSGTDTIAGSTYITSTNYTTAGTKKAEAKVTSTSGQSVTVECSVVVQSSPPPSSSPSASQIPSPSSSASPSSSSSTPSPSSSGVTRAGTSRGFVANGLSAIGEFLDGVFSR